MKKEELSLYEPFGLSLSDNESVLDENKRRSDIEHKIIVDEELSVISDDMN